jgi:hypothetical protein
MATVPGVRRVRHRLRTRVSERPSVYLPFARRKYRRFSPRPIGDDTEMVLDGYTRSASTFAVYALQLAQPRPVRLAHHLHAPAQLIAGVRAGLPTVLVIREPEGAILSQLVREPDVALPDALHAYVRFHECLLPYRHGMVVADFAEVTTDFGAVTRRVNERFGTSLTEFVHTPESEAECLAMIELRGRLLPELLAFESGVVSREDARRFAASVEAGELRDAWVPSAGRAEAKQRLRAQWADPGLTALRSRAGRLYREFVPARPGALRVPTAATADVRREAS